MKIRIFAIGSVKEAFYTLAVNEYVKRIKPYCELEIIEIADEKIADKASDKEFEMVKNKEGEKVLKRLKDNDYVVALDLNQKSYDSPGFAEHLDAMIIKGQATINFLIGGSLGLSDALKKRANEAISFSEMTFPHQLMRVILLEQIYRAFRILHHEPYHK